jgi:hypothetical protein
MQRRSCIWYGAPVSFACCYEQSVFTVNGCRPVVIAHAASWQHADAPVVKKAQRLRMMNEPRHRTHLEPFHHRVFVRFNRPG